MQTAILRSFNGSKRNIRNLLKLHCINKKVEKKFRNGLTKPMYFVIIIRHVTDTTIALADVAELADALDLGSSIE